jgi:hypothetical protein
MIVHRSLMQIAFRPHPASGRHRFVTTTTMGCGLLSPSLSSRSAPDVLRRTLNLSSKLTISADGWR